MFVSSLQISQMTKPCLGTTAQSRVKLLVFANIPCSTFILRGLIFADFADVKIISRRKKSTCKIKSTKILILLTWKSKMAFNPLVLLYIIHWGKKDVYFKVIAALRQRNRSLLQTKQNHDHILFQSLRHKKLHAPR